MARVRIEERDGRLHVRWFTDDSALWHELLDEFKGTFAYPSRRYESESKTWSLPRDEEPWLRDWADANFDRRDQFWAAGTGGGAGGAGRTGQEGDGYRQEQRRDEYYRGGSSRSGLGTENAALQAAYALLCLTPDAPPDLVKLAHHYWARQLHPDTGHGDGARMAQVNNAVDVIAESGQHANKNNNNKKGER